jgi:hypothetical protein
VTAPGSLAQACAAAIEAEIENEALYVPPARPRVRSRRTRGHAASASGVAPASPVGLPPLPGASCWRSRKGSGSRTPKLLIRRRPADGIRHERTDFLPLPCNIGLAIIAIRDAFIGCQFCSMKCEAPGIAQFLALVAVPGVYLVLICPTLRSQE